MESLNSHMKELGIIEVLDRYGRVVQRMEISPGETITVGRSYDNDIILDDGYVCPHHVSMIMQGDQLVVKDLESINGISQNKYHFRGETINLASDETFRLGHTTLRYRSATEPLKPTRIDRHLRNSFWTLQNPWLVLIIFTLLMGFILVETLFLQTEKTDSIKTFADSIPIITTIFAWAGLWSLFGKIMIDRFSFWTHTGIFSLANLGFYLSAIILGYLFYAFDLDGAYEPVYVLLVFLIAVWMLYTHLGYSTKYPHRTMLITAVILTLIGAGFYLLETLVADSEFSDTPSYQVLLKAPEFNFVDGEPLDSFFARTEELKKIIDEKVDLESD